MHNGTIFSLGAVLRHGSSGGVKNFETPIYRSRYRTGTNHYVKIILAMSVATLVESFDLLR